MGPAGSEVAWPGRVFKVVAYDRSGEKARSLEPLGARVSDSPKDLAANCAFVLVSVSDDAAQETAIFGGEGALAGVRARGDITLGKSHHH